MRQFTAEYLEQTREGMWEDSRAALEPLDLPNRERILDVGCGTGELSAVLAAESGAEVVGVDVDTSLLGVAGQQAGIPVVGGDATRLPFPDGSFDLVVCQALLINLPDPAAALREFARVSSDLVATVEPNNAQVGVDSTVEREVTLERSAREAYLEGVETDVALGEQVIERFEDLGFSDIRTRRYLHDKRIEPPYTEAALQSASRKASGAGLADHESELRRSLSEDEYDELRREWREMGRTIIEQMQDREYRRAEVVPFDVTVGTVPDASE